MITENDEEIVIVVARAICRAYFYCDLDKPDGILHWKKNKDRCIKEARAAIIALDNVRAGKNLIVNRKGE